VVALDTNHANAFVIDAFEKFCAPFDQREMHDVFIVISEGRDGDHIARTFCAGDPNYEETRRCGRYQRSTSQLAPCRGPERPAPPR
jgi:hypothetical protein